MNDAQDRGILSFASPTEWQTWLDEHHRSASGIWLKIAKKDSGIASVSYAEALDVALCYGWIDGQKDRYDETWWLQRFTPRQSRSRWSKINRAKAEELIAAGRMKPAGLQEVERAKADGRWERAYDAQAEATIPDDLRRALEQNERANAFFATLDSHNRFAILYRIQDAKRSETRARRIERFVAMLNEGKTIYPSSGSAEGLEELCRSRSSFSWTSRARTSFGKRGAR